MTRKINASRREFLRAASALSIVGSAATPLALNLLATGTAAAQSAGDYKAIVCLFMLGGNDQASTVLATDPSSWNDYLRVRTTNEAGSIALAPAGPGADGVLPITPASAQPGRDFALHPGLGPLQALFNEGRAAIIANVGSLVTPTTLAEFRAKSVPLPPKLFSHNDQQSYWQACESEGAPSGWGGRMGDLIASMNADATFTSISASGNAVFLAGRTINQYQVSASGPIPISGLTSALFGLHPGANPLQAIITGPSSNVFEKEHAAVVRRSIEAQGVLSSAMLPAGAGGVANPPPYINPNSRMAEQNSLATQLQTVARIIAGHGELGARRQVFFINMTGFDTHDFQTKKHADLMARLAHGISYFDTALGNLRGTDMRKQVTLFTASDFGRTFTSNGDGTDHGWGSHHFVVGGAVKGRNIYGAFPVTALGHSHDVGSGSLLPAISVEQYGATLATWFGVSATDIGTIFPNIANFSNRNLGFMS